jgi:hypothetical protein
MYRLFDFSLPIATDLTNGELVGMVLMDLFGACLCALYLSPRWLEWETRRQVKLAKEWGKRFDDEAKALQRTKTKIVVAGSVGVVVCFFLTVRFGVELLRRF